MSGRRRKARERAGGRESSLTKRETENTSSPVGRRGCGKENEKGARGMPVALGGEEGRDKLRKAAGRRKWPLIRGCPNGTTRHAEGMTSRLRREANAGN